jgi:alpha-glucosidase
MRRRLFFFLLTITCSFRCVFAQHAYQSILSPDKKIAVQFGVEGGKAFYTVAFIGRTVLEKSGMGLIRDDEDFSTALALKNATITKVASDKYNMNNAKKSSIIYTANSRTFSLLNKNKQPLDITFNVTNDGVAFRYYFPNKSNDVKSVTEEITTFNFHDSAKAFLQPMSEAKSGWEQTNPAYEEHYKQGMPVGTPAPTKAGWVYPALFNHGSTWLLITEASLDSNYCGSRLHQESTGGEYHLGFPDARETIKIDGLIPRSKLPFYSPWRIITIGSLKTIVESTLGTDLAKGAGTMDKSFIKPGKASWSWINSKDNFIVYKEQKKYIDFAADMHWQYCLVDADWDRKIGYDSIKILADYAKQKNIGLLLWYNSAGDWNTVKYTPKNKLLTHESRVAEFARLQEMGIKGVKIDFFGGDGQSVIKYYIDILNDAAAYKLMVNFHGATLPRGWHRTYPHLITTEAVRGFEMVTFNQADADAEANHCAMLPFTRNAFDPMDFTPMNLYKINTRVKRKTTSAFELALSVLFLSGIQHYAESPEGMKHVPEFAKQFLRDLPNSWDDVKFIDGYPGKYVVIARRAGNKWYVAGINGEAIEKNLSFDLSSLNVTKGTMITDGEQEMFSEVKMDNVKKQEIKLKPNGGFVMVLN